MNNYLSTTSFKALKVNVLNSFIIHLICAHNIYFACIFICGFKSYNNITYLKKKEQIKTHFVHTLNIKGNFSLFILLYRNNISNIYIYI